MNSSQWLTEAQWVNSVAKGNGQMIGGIVSQPPPGFGTDALSIADLEKALDLLLVVPLVRGVRPAFNWNLMNFSTVVQHTRVLAARGLSIDLNVGLAENASQALALCAAVPEAIFILDHIGGVPSQGTSAQVAMWKAQLHQIAAYPNVFVKISGVLQTYKSTHVFPTVAEVAPWVTEGIATFGFERSLFAGNWFFANWLQPPNLGVYASWAEYLTEIVDGMGASDAEKDMLFRGTAAKAYRIAA